MIILADYSQYIKCKDIFLCFAKQFTIKHPNSIEFLLYHKKLLETNPQLTDYIYQFALTSCYSNNVYDSRELETVFNHTFKIKDMYNMNGSECDITTLNTAFVLNHMAKNTPFKKLPLTIFNAPLEYGTDFYYQNQKQALTNEYIQKALKTTGQPNNDCSIGGIYYDIKHKQELKMKLNHILPWTYEQVEQQGSSFLANLYAILSANKEHLAQELSKKLIVLIQAKNITNKTKIEIWNKILHDNWLSLQKTELTFPIIIPMTQQIYKPIMSKSLHNQLHLDNDVVENSLAARKAIAGVTTNIWGFNALKNAEIITSG
jgi:hypothetical protein